MTLKILVGADPEIWLRDKTTGKIVSAHDRLPGTKAQPFKVPKGAIQVDGTAAEFNIDPASSATEFVTNINQVMTNLRDRNPDLDLVLEPTVTYDPDYFYKLPESSRELGCNPDYNAWTQEINPSPKGESTTMRTASGHVHVGWCKDVNPHDPMHLEDCYAVIKQLDYFLGMYSLQWDPDNKRRELYGKAGAFRPKPYGAEYRTMSNVWLRSTAVTHWIFESANYAVQRLASDSSMADKYAEWARECIDNNVEWWLTPKGTKFHEDTGLRWPNYKECLIQTKMPPQEVVKNKKARHLYGNTVNNVFVDFETINQNEINGQATVQFIPTGTNN